MTITNLSIPFPDFQLNDVIDPEQFDLNNSTILDKVNLMIDLLNKVTDGGVEGDKSGASYINVKNIGVIEAKTLQAYLDELYTRLTSSEGIGNGSTLIGSPLIQGLEGTTVHEQLKNLQKLSEDNQLETIYQLSLKADKSDTYTKAEVNSRVAVKANRVDVYTRAELEPYLRGGDTTIRYDVFRIVSINTTANTFVYSNKAGQNKTGTISGGSYTFTLEAGTYTLNTNQVKAIINDTIHKNVASGGLVEVSETQIALTDAVKVGDEITIEYFERVNVSGELGVYVSPTIPVRNGHMLWIKTL